MSNKEQKGAREAKKPKSVDKKSKDKTPKYMSGGSLGDVAKAAAARPANKK